MLFDRILTRFRNGKEFEFYQDQVLFMMALNNCNALVRYNVAGAQKKFDTLTLDSNLAKAVTELATKALWLSRTLLPYAIFVN